MKADSPNPLITTEDVVLDEASIARYLQEHPDFFKHHEDLLLSLRIPHKSGKAISLLERQVALLRNRNEDSQKRIKDFIGNAKDNDELFEKTRIIILEILKTKSLQDLSSLISGKLNNDFDASNSQLFFASATADEGQTDNGESLDLLPLEKTKKVLGELFQRKRAYCGTLESSQSKLFFPKLSKSISSAAIIPIHLHDNAGVINSLPGIPLLVIASNKANHFNTSLDTLFLDFIGEVLAVHIANIVL